MLSLKGIERRVKIKSLWDWKVWCTKGIVSHVLVINFSLGLECIKKSSEPLAVTRSSKIGEI